MAPLLTLKKTAIIWSFERCYRKTRNSAGTLSAWEGHHICVSKYSEEPALTPRDIYDSVNHLDKTCFTYLSLRRGIGIYWCQIREHIFQIPFEVFTAQFLPQFYSLADVPDVNILFFFSFPPTKKRFFKTKINRCDTHSRVLIDKNSF